MRKSLSILTAALLCLALSLSVLAAGSDVIEAEDTPPDDLIWEPVNNDVTKEEKSEDPAKENENVIELPDTPPAPEKPAIGSYGGYSSPIVNFEDIEVPLADGTTIVLPFLDVPENAYYTEAVAWAYSNDITGGVADDRFDPLATCTRGQMVTFLWRAAGCPEPTGTASAFSDVVAGSWYEKAVAWAVENGITDGVGGGKFDPNGIVNRAQAVTFLYRAKGAPETTASEGFTDVGIGEYYTVAVAWAVANGITNGVGDNAFAPNANCVRGQTVTFLYRAYK